MHPKLKRLGGHAAIVVFIGLAAGFGLLMSLIGGFELLPGMIIPFEFPGETAAWARAHAGGITNGLLMFAVALFAHQAGLPERVSGHLSWMLIGTGYANTAFYYGAIFSPSRALTFGDNRLGESTLWGILGFLPALIFAFVAMVAMVMIARHALGKGQ